MPTRKVPISPEVAAVLQLATVEGPADRPVLKLNQPGLDRRLYQDVDRVLQAQGGKWDRRAGGHVFDRPVDLNIANWLDDGHVVDERRSAEQFFTPVQVARRMADKLGLPARDIRHILEPSAGNGRLVQAALEHGVEFLTIVEKDPDLVVGLADMLPHCSGGVWAADFMEWSPTAAAPIDAVMMNPPFSGNQDIRHVLRALEFLRPGGRLVAVMSVHFTFANDAPSRAFRKLIGYPEEFRLGEETGVELGGSPVVADASVELLPRGTFQESGANVSAVLVTIVKGD